MQRAAAAVAEQGEIARIVAACNGNFLDERRHCEICDRQHALCGADGAVAAGVAERVWQCVRPSRRERAQDQAPSRRRENS